MFGRMNQSFRLGTWFGLKMSITPLSVLSYLAVVPLAAGVAGWWGALSVSDALSVGAVSVVIMFVCENLHQWGHSRAARRTGYPMIGVHHFSLFSACLYPLDEPHLPPAIHIRRALGGFWINLLIGLLLGAAALSLWPQGGVAGWVTAISAIWNFFVLGLGALLPIDIPGVFTIDGGTIWRYLREGKRLQHNAPDE